jgi:hypothetical protein
MGNIRTERESPPIDAPAAAVKAKKVAKTIKPVKKMGRGSTSV